jgi:REP element-mobilizing transposase RayT
MARHLRLEYEGAVYHITSRGNERSDIFRDEHDKEKFVEKLAEIVEEHHVRLYAYVIMTNHYHLLAETPRGNLSRFMQQLNTSYTMYYNVKHNRCGHVFSGRYKAKVVNGDEYLLALTRYIHLNPVKVRVMKGLDVAEKLKRLRGYRWSSYRGYAGLAGREEWIDHGPLSELAGRYAAERRDGYRALVESGLAEDDEEMKEVMSISSKAIGGREFCREVEKDYRQAVEEKHSRTDVAMRRIEVGADADELLERVCAEFGVGMDSLSRRRSVADARLVAVRLLKDQTNFTGREVAQRLGLADGSGLANLLKIAEYRLSGSWSLRRSLEKLRQNK